MKVKRSAGAKVGLIVGLVICAGLTWLGIDFWWQAKRVEAEVAAALVAEPARLAVDLAKRGVYEAPLAQRHSRSDGQGVFLDADPPFGSEAEMREALDGLSFDLRIQDATGKEVVHCEHTLTPLGADADKQAPDLPGYYAEWLFAQPAWFLVCFQSLHVGEYRFAFKVLEPAPGMAGRPHALVVKNMLYEGVKLYCWEARVRGGGCFVLAGIVGIVTIALWWRAGRRARARLAGESDNAA